MACEGMRLRVRRRDGQAALEFLLVTAAMLAMVAILAVLLYAFREHGGRALDLVASEYP
jgi:hypothetical protein